MKTAVRDFPRITCILRGYTREETQLVLEVLRESRIRSVEITMNTDGALSMIREAVREFGKELSIGAGTVTDMEQLKEVMDAGVDFVLSPIMFTREMLDCCRSGGVTSVPAALTPTEILTQLAWGADIVKVFPAATVGPAYFKQLKGPMGHLPLMAVGGVDAGNAAEFMRNGCDYLGIGSGMFDREMVTRGDRDGMRESIKAFVEAMGAERI